MRIDRTIFGAVVIVAGAALAASAATPAGGKVLNNGQPFTYRLSSSGSAAGVSTAFAEARQIIVPRRNATAVGTTAQTATVRVNAQAPWTATNVTVRSGDVLSFQVTGQIRPAASVPAVGPAGGGGESPNYPVPNAPMGALIGRVGSGQPFLIGASTVMTMPADGQLFLGINDDNVSDNSGAFSVRIGPANAVGTSGQTAALGSAQGNTFTVDAKRPWTATGISVQQGERLTFTVSGTVSWAHGPHDRTTGNGGPLDPMRQNDYPVPAAGVAALIGRVNGQPFAIGQSGQAITMPASGELFLGINDDYFGDNDGAYTVTVHVTGGAVPRR